MAFYSAERNWENGGPQLEHPRLSAFQDNAHNYHGVLINCLAYMSGKDWSRLHLIKMTLEPPDKYYQLKSYRPDIAELFLSVISGIESEQDQAASRGGRQFTMFQK